MSEALEQVVIAMFGYMTELDTVDIDRSRTFTIEAKGHDMHSLLFAVLDEFLFHFSTEDTIVRDVRVTDCDLHSFKVTARGFGERFDLAKHPQGTEIKAITYSNMQVHTDKKTGRVDIYVIVDI
eukprot:TRINITY_DN67124_c0_g1_i1.p3 TRINITY_DN67124_c0_g1~~TRINITY_DN67124_c0_g1_i1.p3  ORF type:complete len:124 (-),score=62.43 TRINITY_DN67124_c0_g1_i1:116-487(-)